ncbi:MAG: hypothetical protein AAF802_07315 [Planctomycetota bacterium]
MNQAVLKFLTIALLIGLVSFLVYREVKPRLESEQPVEEEAIDSEKSNKDAARREALRTTKLGSFGRPSKSAEQSRTADMARRNLSLRVGPIGSTPMRSELVTLDGLPFESATVRQLFVGSRERTCHLLPVGAPVSPPMVPPATGASGTIGRNTVLTIGLELDEANADNLPVVTAGQVKHYFASHRLAVQPTLYYDDEGRLYFGTDCSAAFFEIERAGMTVTAEPMIESAIKRFRVLGIVGAADGSRLPADSHGRTLALAFTFIKKEFDERKGEEAAKTVTEFLLLHVPSTSTAADVDIDVFVTSDGRTNLHRVETDGLTMNAPLPILSAGIQFNKTVLMGVYPADPIVSGIRYRSAGVLAMETIERLTRGNEGRTPISVTEILDQFSRLAVQLPDRAF